MAVIVTKRIRSIIRTPGDDMWEYHTILQVAGLPHYQVEDLTRKMDVFNYKSLCNCDYCVSYGEKKIEMTEELKGEPMAGGLAQIFNVLIDDWKYDLKSTSVIQNGDGFSTTTWILCKPVVTNKVF